MQHATLIIPVLCPTSGCGLSGEVGWGVGGGWVAYTKLTKRVGIYAYKSPVVA